MYCLSGVFQSFTKQEAILREPAKDLAYISERCRFLHRAINVGLSELCPLLVNMRP